MLKPYDREELYRKVWEKPLLKVAEEYGVRNRGVALRPVAHRVVLVADAAVLRGGAADDLRRQPVEIVVTIGNGGPLNSTTDSRSPAGPSVYA